MKPSYKMEYVAGRIGEVYIRAHDELYKSVGLSRAEINAFDFGVVFSATGPIRDILPLARATDALWWEVREGG